MKNNTAKGPITVLGIDLAKQSFQLHGVNEKGEVVLKKKLNRKQLSAFMANLPVCLIGLEACGGSHHWVRIFTEMGHTVRMMAPQFVKPYIKSNKNDAVDADYKSRIYGCNISLCYEQTILAIRGGPYMTPLVADPNLLSEPHF